MRQTADTTDASDLQAKEELSQTAEANVDLLFRRFLGLHADGYFFYSTNPIVDTPVVEANSVKRGFVNLSSRTLAGLNVGAQLLVRPIKLWGYYSRILTAEDSCAGLSLPSTYPCTDTTFVGDVALNKGWAGLTLDVAPVTATVLTRIIGERTTVLTNPVGSVDAYATIDANLTVSNVPFRGLTFGLRVTNIVGTEYNHPGIRTADSGNTAPAFATDGTYTGSLGDYNSLMPQAGRGFYGTLGLAFDPEEPQKATGK